MRDPKVALSVSLVSVDSIGPCATTLPSRSISTWVNPTGIVPVGPTVDLSGPTGRTRFLASAAPAAI